MSAQLNATTRSGGGRRVFDESKELDIAIRVLSGQMTRQALADSEGVHRNTVANIVERREDEARAVIAARQKNGFEGAKAA